MLMLTNPLFDIAVHLIPLMQLLESRQELSYIFFRYFSQIVVKMPPFAKQKDSARTHQEALGIVCAACWRKPKNVRGVSDRVAGLIRQFVYKDYSKSNGYHPTAVCTGCQQTLSDLAKVKLLNCCKLKPR